MTLGDVVTFTGGFSFKSSDWKPGGVPVIKIANVRDGDVTLDGCSFVDAKIAALSSAYAIQKGDLLMTLTGEIGAMGFYKLDTDARLNQRLCKVSTKNTEELSLEYVHYFLTSPTARQTMWQMSKGAAQANISIKDIATLVIPLPPLEAQKAIVEALDDHLSRLDKALFEVELGRIKEKLFKRSLLHSIFENLDSDVFELGNVSKPKYGKDVPKHLRGDGFAYPVVGSAGVMTYTEVALVEAPSVLVGRKGNVGAVQMFATPCSPVDTAYYLICPEDVDLEFMYFQLQSIDLKSLDSSTTIPSLRRQDLEAVHFRKPDLATQRAISQEIKIKLSSIDAALDQLRTISATLSVLRRSLLNAAFTGTLLKDVQ